jgi:Lrp/AsnC family transcriptional regulator, regulator for asnA, asnC and gidA
MQICLRIATKLFKFVQYMSYVKFNSHESILDDVNLQIIDILGKDSSMRFVEIAKEIGVSDATIHIRVRRLIAERIISKFTLCLDNDLLGYDHLAFAGINIKPGLADQVIEELSYVEEVLEIHEMHNRYDLLLKIRAKDLNHMRDIIHNKISRLPNILKIKLMTVLKTSKEEQIVSLKKDIQYNNKHIIELRQK